MNEGLRRQVRDRAGGACEYCRLPQAVHLFAFEIEHVIAAQHGGPTRPNNLALACPHCNRHKGPNIAGIDPDSGRLTRLFHPRTDVWSDHFAWSGHVLVGRTEVGRTTIAVLAVNHPIMLSVRAALLLDGVFPPAG